GIDLVHSMASTAPLRGSFRRITTVHDLIYLIYPEAHAGVLSLGMRVLVGQAARRSHRLIADSRCTAADLQERLRVPEDKIGVVPLGVTPPPRRHADVDELRLKYALAGRKVVLAASAKRPHKNL